ncbi:MAG: hypothetical protein KDA54_22595, partial [Phycisphaerales bacterium]|nr:hypothetical protein [Phycisphaerales bacterium]
VSKKKTPGCPKETDPVLSGGEKLYGNRPWAKVRITYSSRLLGRSKPEGKSHFLIFYIKLRIDTGIRHIAKAKLYQPPIGRPCIRLRSLSGSAQ